MDELSLLADFLYKEIGYAVPKAKYYLIERAVKPLLETYGSYANLIAQASLKQELQQQLFDAVTINETYFFREPRLWDSLRTTVLPELQQAVGFGQPLRALVCACSRGQEVWTLAMLVSESFPALQLSIDAVDLDSEVLSYAEAGEYADLEVKRGLSHERRDRFLQQLGKNRYRVKDELRQRVGFSQLNLASDWRRPALYDLVFCRNVLIYFSPEGRRHVGERITAHMKPNGYLFLGGCEQTIGIDDRLVSGKAGQVHALRLGWD